ncbi:four-carbon acid sugar kinase family protein [Marinactinospora rubrisoli]|uniref:Four-carbon acid sugar kinase family protein n=1 Tax=Marinactinospora rubrisoli TaxID=2715399 RepID=A0ABW2KG73_9ACTN
MSHPPKSTGARGTVPLDRLLTGQPAVRPVPASEVAARVTGGPRLVVLDDDPTGTQSVTDVPVLTRWEVDDLRWGLRQDSTALFVLTNSRSLGPADAADRARAVIRALRTAATAEGVDFAVASRSDSTLRGHFPLETDAIADELAATGAAPIDGVVIVPAYVEPGRLTIDSTHWMRTDGGMLPVGESEFARDATFGYRSSDLRDWVAEKMNGRVRAADVLAVTLTDLRVRGPEHVAGLLAGLRDGRPAVVDAACDDDLRVLALALADAEARGTRLLYRVGPSFVRARSGQDARPPLTRESLHALTAAPDGDARVPAAAHGLIAVGSHVGLTTRQLDRLRSLDGITEFELHVPTLLDADRRAGHIADTAAACVAALAHGEVVLRTSRDLVVGGDADSSLAIAREVSAALVASVRAVTAELRPAFVVAKGGITSSDIATEGLEVRRAWARGTMLPGIVSLWQPVSGPGAGIPYVVFPGNVGDDDALAVVVDHLRNL